MATLSSSELPCNTRADERTEEAEARLDGPIAELNEPHLFAALTEKLRQQWWVVYATPTFGSSVKMLNYLSCCTHCVAISNDRIMNMERGPSQLPLEGLSPSGVRVKPNPNYSPISPFPNHPILYLSFRGKETRNCL